ncbi:MAG: amidohydrolase [Beijerinckiaceae bacterium]|nr:amidohydrolase [Beijerinckiaceae bacterium]
MNGRDNASNSPEKDVAEQFIDRNAQAIRTLNDSIFYFGELGMQEFETAGLMSGLLEKEGFKVERGIAGFPTGFCATYGSGAPVIAIHTEYDANPDNSQRAGIAEQACIVEGAPGHCEGHNVNGTVMIAGALAAREAMEKFGLKGTLKVFGAPAEEQLVSRPYFVREGYFDDVDLAIAPHIAAEFGVGYGLIQSALISATFTFHGESAHAGVAPWKGRDALDGVVLMDVGMAEYREHMTKTMSAQRVITNGGDQPNVIPRKASVWWYFRDSSADGAMRLFERARKIAQGAALMSDTEVEVDVMSAVWPVRGNQTVAELVQREYERVGQPEWTEEEDKLARELQVKAKAKVEGLRRDVHRMKGPAEQKPSANDAGDVSWKAPMAKMYFPANIPNINFHHWAAGVALATSIAHKGASSGAKVLANSIIECFVNPSVVAEAKRTHAKEIEGVDYKSMLPPDQKPPVSLNAPTMSKYRDAMREHYIKEKPVFS